MLMASLGLLGLLAVSAAVYVAWQASRSPEGRIGAKLEPPRPGIRRIVCAGDSLTHGTVSFDYVGALRARLGPGVEVLNAGANGDLAFNLAARLVAVVV